MGKYFKKLFSFDGMDVDLDSKFITLLVVAILFAFVGATQLGKKMVSFFFERETYTIRTHIGMLALASLFFVVSLSAITTSGFNPFIYFRF